MLVKPNDLTKEILKLKSTTFSARVGIPTNIIALDELIYLNKQFLLICTGAASSGKSEFMDAIALNTAISNGWKWAFFSPENHPVQMHMKKHIERYIGKALWQASVAEIQAATEFLSEYMSFIKLPEDKRTIKCLLEDIQKAKDTDIIDGYVLDPWNEIDHSEYAHLRDDQYLSQILTRIRNFNRDNDLLGCIVIHPKGLNRDKNGEFPIPTLSDCHGGIMWRSKADYGICVHRHDMSKDEVTVYVQKRKYKDHGTVGNCMLHYHQASGRFKSKTENEFLLPNQIESAF